MDGTSSPLTSRGVARSPLESPAKTRLPDAKTTSGLLVRGSTTTSPRIPCALRISPTIAYSGPDIAGAGLCPGGRLFFRSFRQRNRCRLELDAESLLVTPLEHAGAPKERPYGVAWLGADAE